MGKKISLFKKFLPVMLFALAFVILYVALIYSTHIIPMIFLGFLGLFVFLQACECIDKNNGFGEHLEDDNDNREESRSRRNEYNEIDDNFRHFQYLGSSKDNSSDEEQEEPPHQDEEYKDDSEPEV